MAKSKLIRFQEFRIQINPIPKGDQMDLLPDPEELSLANLTANKNKFFDEALDSITNFSFQSETTNQKLLAENSKFIFRIGAQREVDLENKDFSHQSIANWPSLLVMIDSSKEVQTMLIEKKSLVFQMPRTVAGIFEENINRVLVNRRLQCYIRPMFEESNFWDLMRKHKGNVKVVDFTLVTPNMANISRALDAGLKHLVKETHSAKTNVRLESAPESALRIEQNDAVTNGLVDYASKGGGEIVIKVNNLKKKISTTSSVKEVSISELEIKGKSPRQLLRTLEMLLK